MENKNIEFLLFINPRIEQKSKQPIDDVYVEAMAWALSLAEKGTTNLGRLFYPFYPSSLSVSFQAGSCYRGFHEACDGECSTSFDYLLQIPENYVVNSLSVHYLRWFRDAIPQEEWVKLDNVKAHYEKHIATQFKNLNPTLPEGVDVGMDEGGENTNTFVTRMVEERTELLGRIDRLSAFMETEDFKNLDLIKKCLMGEQLHAMKMYAKYLSERIDLENE